MILVCTDPAGTNSPSRTGHSRSCHQGGDRGCYGRPASDFGRSRDGWDSTWVCGNAAASDHWWGRTCQNDLQARWFTCSCCHLAQVRIYLQHILYLQWNISVYSNIKKSKYTFSLQILLKCVFLMFHSLRFQYDVWLVVILQFKLWFDLLCFWFALCLSHFLKFFDGWITSKKLSTVLDIDKLLDLSF